MGKRKLDRAAGRSPAAQPQAQAPSAGGPSWWIKGLILLVPLLVVAAFVLLGPMRDRVTGGAGASGTAAGVGGAPMGAASPRGGNAPMGSASPQAGAADQAAGDRAHMGDEEVRQMAARLAARLEREPRDAAGWRTLARTYYVLKQFPEAVRAYERLSALGPLDADVLADYADSLAMAQGQRLAGKPMELAREALEKNPAQWKALSMTATDAFQRGDMRLAIAHWERALQALPQDSEMAAGIRESLAQARAAKPGG